MEGRASEATLWSGALLIHVKQTKSELDDFKSVVNLAVLSFIIILSCLEATYGECAPAFDMCNHLL